MSLLFDWWAEFFGGNWQQFAAAVTLVVAFLAIVYAVEWERGDRDL